MKHVIHIYGASGAGTSTLGRALCREQSFSFLDTDDYFWMPGKPEYTVKRERGERIENMQRAIQAASNAVVSGSLVDWGDALIPLFTLAIRIETDAAIRMARLKERETKKFGDRIKPGGDMYENHLKFMKWASAYDTGGLEMRSRAKHDAWETLLHCPRILLDGARDLGENVQEAVRALSLL